MELESVIGHAVSDMVNRVPAPPDPMPALRAALRRRRQQRRALAAAVMLAVVPSVAVTYGVTQAVADARAPRGSDQGPVTGTAPQVPVRPCGAGDLTDVRAAWAPISELVLSGTVQVTSAAPTPCTLHAPRFNLVDTGGAAIDPRLNSADVLDREADTVLMPGHSAAAVIRWGGSYCGNAREVRLGWTLPAGGTVSATLPTRLQCVSTPYYEKGQSSTAASQFVVLP